MGPRRSTESAEELRASLVTAAGRLVARDGPMALTMRALAAEAGCSVGLPYKVFTDRRDLVAEVMHSELAGLTGALDEFAGRAGTGTVGGNLVAIADLLLSSPAVALAHEVFADEHLMKMVTHRIHESGGGPEAFETVFEHYLVAEQRAGRVAAEADVNAFALVLAGAVHNLIVSGPAYPRPTKRQLRRVFDAIAARLVPCPTRPPEEDHRGT